MNRRTTRSIKDTQANERKYSMKAVAALLGVHVATISRLLSGSKLGYYQIGGRRVVGQTHLNDYLARAERQPINEAVI
jgi:excisionase family DNA binding protein